MAFSKHLQAIFPLFSLALFLILANKVDSQDVTSFNYTYFNASNPANLTFEGDAEIPPSDNYLRLLRGPRSTRSNFGRVWYSQPVQFWQKSTSRQAIFQTTIRFVIHPGKNGAADGLTFFILPANTTIGANSGGGNLGLFGDGLPPVFAVEFDTKRNWWDPSYRHIGIDINSRVSKATTSFDSATAEVVTARINYNPNTRVIYVVASSPSQQSVSVSHVIDLKTILPEVVQVGLSAGKGGNTLRDATFDVYSWSFTSVLAADYNKNEETYIRQMV